MINEVNLPKKILPDAKSKDITCERTQIVKSITTTSNPIDKIGKFDFTNLKVEKIFMDEYQH